MSRRVGGFQYTKDPFVEDNEPKKIEAIKFSVQSESEILKAGEVDVWRPVFYDVSKRPIPNGLLDPKMGPPNKYGTCATCHGNYDECRGHYGSLTLVLPVFNIGYVGAIVEILKCICKSCSRVLLGEEECRLLLKKMRDPRNDALKKTALKKGLVKRMSTKKQIECLRCGYLNGKVKKDKSVLTIAHDRPRSAQESSSPTGPLNPVKVLSLFKRMQDQDCELLYLNDRPENLLLTNIPVPPMAIRPSILVDGGKSNENDITVMLKNIMDANNSLRGAIQESSHKRDQCIFLWEALQNAAALYINSEANVGPTFQKEDGKKLSGFIQRLKGKQGRFRGNLSGKRVQYTGRTVISPDPNLKITQVGIPIHMALILTYPERVTCHNIEKLKQCVRNGPKKHPGAKYITEPNGTVRYLSFAGRARVADELKFGYIVDRHLEDGDVVLFNRQPSLHRMSIMCHRAKIMQWRTLRFNESVCNPYNADFDGDEMNVHVPQTEEARTEALLLMGVQDNLCTPKNGVILVASTQDFLTSSFLITRKDTFYDRAAFSLMCSYMGDAMDHIDFPTPALVKPIELWTGKQLFNVLLRPSTVTRVYVTLMAREKNYSKPDDRKSECPEETMCPNDGFVYFRNSELICGQLGKATLGNGNKAGLYPVLLRDYNAHAAAACMNRLAKLSARWIGNHGFSIGIDDVQPGKLLNDKKSSRIEEGSDECDGIIKSYNAGKLPLMPGYDAAETLEAKITKTLNEIRDTTSKVCMKELHWRNSPLIMSQCGSKGSPINISQMVACVGQQAVGGRRVPDGFIDRSLPHFPRQSKTPAAKGFVANSFYTGLSATEFFFHTMGGREGLVDTAVKTADVGYMSRRLMKALDDLAVCYDMTVRNSSETLIQFAYGDDSMDPAQMEGAEGFPLDVGRLLLKAQATCPDGKNPSLTLDEVKENTEKRLSHHDIDSNESWSHAFKKMSEFVETSVGENKWRITQRQLEVFLDSCIHRLRSKILEAGTAIGAIGAQSIGEPGTQMTLKTFHFAGVASMNVTLGVPRIKEIINASKKISTPIITANLEDDDNMEIAQSIKGHIEKTLLGQVAKWIKLQMTATATATACIVVKLDMEKIEALRLNINAWNVEKKITELLNNRDRHRKMIKPVTIEVINGRKLRVIPKTEEKKDLHFVLHWVKNRLPMVVVKGISTVERAIIAKVEGKKEKLQLIVEGIGLLKVMGTEGINGRNTDSNHVLEVNKTLGIEAARACIIREIKKVMENHSMEIDIRHMMLLADVMTYKGEVLAMDRFGLAKMKDSTLMLASFETPAIHLFNASLTGKDEKVVGITQCIILGVPVQVGTGMLKLIQRVQEVPALEYRPDSIIS